MNFDTLIGLEVSRAKDILSQNGFDNVEVKENLIPDEKCNELLVCAVKQGENLVTLVCGGFYIIKN